MGGQPALRWRRRDHRARCRTVHAWVSQTGRVLRLSRNRRVYTRRMLRAIHAGYELDDGARRRSALQSVRQIAKTQIVGRAAKPARLTGRSVAARHFVRGNSKHAISKWLRRNARPLAIARWFQFLLPGSASMI